jgi:hypothetical protein
VHNHFIKTSGQRLCHKKVRIFAWRLAQESLATQINRKHRKLEENGRCQICGMDDESGHHVVRSKVH